MVGGDSGRATPFLRRNRPSAIPNHQPRRNATYHSREAVQTTEASSIREADESRHAEIIAIAQARRTLAKKLLRDCTIYSTVEPCAMCSFVIRAAGIRRVVFALHSPVMGGMSRWDILQHQSPRAVYGSCMGQRPRS